MIKFFRSIRKKFLSQGRTGKYFQYAIGEIILVVIGILIALQINNWNDGRKDRIVEKEYLNSLVTDLNEDINKISFALNGNVKLVEGLEALLDLIAEPLDTEEKQRKVFLNSVKYTYWYLNVDFSENTLSQLINNNGFQLIKDKEITDAILQYQKGILKSKQQYDELFNYFHALEERQKELFNLSLGREAYNFLEENYLNMFEPLEAFDQLIPQGNYIVNKDSNVLNAHYGDILFYKTTMSLTNDFIKEQNNMAKDLIHLIEKKYKLND